MRFAEIESNLFAELRTKLSQTPPNVKVIEEIVSPADIFANDDYSFDDPGEAASPDSKKNSYHGQAVDFWFADGVEELRTAVRKFNSKWKKDVLPIYDEGGGVAFLFRPVAKGRKKPHPVMINIAEGENAPVQEIRNIEDALYGQHHGLRVIVFGTTADMPRPVLLCQIKSERIEMGQHESVLDAARKYFVDAKSRFVFWLSPQPSQFGVLKQGKWWDRIAQGGRLHLVLCNLEMLGAGPSDTTSPEKGAIENFRRLQQRFYPDSWYHVSKAEKEEAVLDCLLSSLDEGATGRLKAYRIPKTAGVTCVNHEGCKRLGGVVRLSFLKACLRKEETIFSALSSGKRVASLIPEGRSEKLGAAFRILSEDSNGGGFPRMENVCELIFNGLKSLWGEVSIADDMLRIMRDELFLLLANECAIKLDETVNEALCRILNKTQGSWTSNEVALFREMAQVDFGTTVFDRLVSEVEAKARKVVSVLADVSILRGRYTAFSEKGCLTEEDSVDSCSALLRLLGDPETVKAFLLDADWASSIEREQLAIVRTLEPSGKNSRVDRLARKIKETRPSGRFVEEEFMKCVCAFRGVDGPPEFLAAMRSIAELSFAMFKQLVCQFRR